MQGGHNSRQAVLQICGRRARGWFTTRLPTFRSIAHDSYPTDSHHVIEQRFQHRSSCEDHHESVRLGFAQSRED